MGRATVRRYDERCWPSDTQIPEVSAEMPVSADEASQVAERYLDACYPGVKVSDEVTAFYGYYTMDIERDGKIRGSIKSLDMFNSQGFYMSLPDSCYFFTVRLF